MKVPLGEVVGWSFSSWVGKLRHHCPLPPGGACPFRLPLTLGERLGAWPERGPPWPFLQKASLLVTSTQARCHTWLKQEQHTHGQWRIIQKSRRRCFHFFLTFYFVLRYSQLTNSAVRVSGEQQRDAAIHIPVSVPPQTPLPIQAGMQHCAIQ